MSRKSCLIRLFKTTVSCKLFTAIILSVFLVQ
ncbi:fimbrial chaperone protein, partial [Escherichia coli]